MRKIPIIVGVDGDSSFLFSSLTLGNRIFQRYDRNYVGCRRKEGVMFARFVLRRCVFLVVAVNRPIRGEWKYENKKGGGEGERERDGLEMIYHVYTICVIYFPFFFLILLARGGCEAADPSTRKYKYSTCSKRYLASLPRCYTSFCTIVFHQFVSSNIPSDRFSS